MQLEMNVKLRSGHFDLTTQRSLLPFRSYSEGISIQNQIQVRIWRLIPDSESLIV